MDRKNTLKIITYVCAVVLLTAVALGIGQFFRGSGYAQAGNYTVGDAEITGAAQSIHFRARAACSIIRNTPSIA